MRLVTRIVVELPETIAEAIGHEARRLLLGRRAYIRYLLAVVAAEVAAVRALEPRDSHPDGRPLPDPAGR